MNHIVILYTKYDPLRANLVRLFVCFVLFIAIKMFYCIIKNDLNLFRSVEMCTYIGIYIYISYPVVVMQHWICSFCKYMKNDVY